MKAAWLVLVAVMMAWPLDVGAQKEPASKPKVPSEPAEKVPRPRKAPMILGHISIGDPAHDFVLENASGASVRLSKLKGDWLLLVFADRGRQVTELQRIDGEMRLLGARIVGVCHEKAARLKSLSERDSVAFQLLADVTGEIAAMYGLYDRYRSETQPGLLIIDRRGIVRSAVLGQELPPEQVAQIARAKITGI